MGLGSTIGGLIKGIAGTLTKAVSEIEQIAGVFINIKDYTVGAFNDAVALIQEIETEYDKITNLDVQPHWRSRVISVPKVIDNIKEIANLPTQIIDAVKDLISNFQGRFEALEIQETVEEFLPVLGQIFGVASLIAEILLAIRATINDLKTIVDAIKTVREDLENLDLIFLQQKNPRHWSTERAYRRVS